MYFGIKDGTWLNKPSHEKIDSDELIIRTEPNTDFWQRSYYGFRNENAPAYLFETDRNFTFTARCRFNYKERFDQSGVIAFIDNENWFKASIEYEDGVINRLGSVCTNFGYSDWATTDISTVSEIWYRLSRRGPDFLIESSFDGFKFKQMRILHLHKLGITTAEMGKANPPAEPNLSVKFGIYACSPGNSSFVSRFSDLTLETCMWTAHE